MVVKVNVTGFFTSAPTTQENNFDLSISYLNEATEPIRGMFAAAGAATFLTIVLCLWLIINHFRIGISERTSNNGFFPIFRLHAIMQVCWILITVLGSFGGLIFPIYLILLEFITGMFMAVFIKNFLNMLIEMGGGALYIIKQARSRHPRELFMPVPFNYITHLVNIYTPKGKMNANIFMLCEIMVSQAAHIHVVMCTLALFLNMSTFYSPGILKAYSSYTWITVTDTMSRVIAYYFLLVLYEGFSDQVPTSKIRLKLIVAQLLLMPLSLQQLLISLVITNIPANLQNSLIFPSDLAAKSWSYFFECIEMFAIAILLLYAYPLRGEIDIVIKEGVSVPVIRSNPRAGSSNEIIIQMVPHEASEIELASFRHSRVIADPPTYDEPSAT